MTVHQTLLNRELSWLDFNGRVLEEAESASVPLAERLRFLAIFSSNLDEFFMVRVAGLRQLAILSPRHRDPAGMTAQEQLAAISRKLQPLLKRREDCWERQLLPELAAHGLHLADPAELNGQEEQILTRFFQSRLLPRLTPLLVAPDRPFPILASGATVLAVRLASATRKKNAFSDYGFVEIPDDLPHFLAVPELPGRFFPAEAVTAHHLDRLFPHCMAAEVLPFRITRDMDLAIDEESNADLLDAVRTSLLRRRAREPVRLELPQGAHGALTHWLLAQFHLDSQLIFRLRGPLDFRALTALAEALPDPACHYPPLPPLPHPVLSRPGSIFEQLRRAGSALLAVPFQEFSPLVKLLESAAADPDVLAIWQTLYRVSGDSPVVRALQRAAEHGKQVTVIVELKARFDEGNNIGWAEKLEASGARVIYGIRNLKIHCKAILIVRREAGELRRYVQLGTGNYNDRTARQYTDLHYFSTDPVLAGEVATLFNVMTGRATPEEAWRRIAASPFDLRRRILFLIDRETALAEAGKPAEITAKMNSLSDPEVIRHLLAAARAGVRVALIVRGICCLLPESGSANLRVVSIVGRYLEHSRIFRFGNGGDPEYYLSSADWMPRNLDRRIEILFPIAEPEHRRILDHLLELQLNDTAAGRELEANGRYTRRAPSRAEAAPDSQTAGYALFKALPGATEPAEAGQ